jgi:hypothetical protein
MIKKSIVGLLHLGGDLRYLRGIKQNFPLTHSAESAGKGIFVKRTIERFLEGLEEYNLGVTSRATGQLREFLKKVNDRPIGTLLTKEEAEQIVQMVQSLEKTFYAEATGIHSFFTSEKRISMDKLTVQQETLFPAGVFGELPDIAKYDVREAGMCIAFERATAAAFHVLRATEAVLRELYCRTVKQKRVKCPTWGNISSDLATRKKKPSATMMKNLDYIRENFRNPTNHPEIRYDIEEAQSLFNLCVDVMCRMIKDPLWKKQ